MICLAIYWIILPIQQTQFKAGVSNTRAVCGPLDAFVWPANTSKTGKIIYFDQI